MNLSGTTTTALAGKTPLRMELAPMVGIELAAKYYGARTGGDFYDGIHVGTRVAFMVGDIAGRKAQAHPIAAAAQETFRGKAAEFYGSVDANLMDATAALIHEINHALIAASKGSHFAPTFVGCYDRELGLLAYVNAGGLTAVIRDSDGTRALPNAAMPMGLFTHLTYEPSMQVFEPGARLLVVTKGVIEQQRGKKLFGAERVMEMVGASKGSAAELCGAVVNAAHDFSKPRWFGSAKKHAGDDLSALVVVRP